MAAVQLPLRRSEYHANKAKWRDSRTLKGRYYGIELEVEAADGDCYDVMRAMPLHDEAADGPAPFFEEDGSLDDDAGVEIVFPPLTPEQIRSPQGYLARSLAAIDPVACVDGPCGMHINVNCADWTAGKRAVFLAVIHNIRRAALECIGGRRLNEWCFQYDDNHFVHDFQDEPRSHHDYAAEIKDGEKRLECRFPGATTNLEQVARVCIWLELLEDFAQEYERYGRRDSNFTADDIEKLYYKWMGENPEPMAQRLLQEMQDA